MTNGSDVFDEDSQLFQEVNAATVRSMVPVVVLLAALSALGLLGNSSVVYYYGFRVPRTPSSHFILVLATFDLVMSAVGIPMEIVDLRFFYTFDSKFVCKTLTFVTAYVAIGSLLTLLVICCDRYRRICSPFKRQIQKGTSKLLSFVVAATALALSWPMWVLYAIQEVTVTTDIGTVVGKDCTFTKDSSSRKYLIAMTSVYLCLFIIVVMVIVTKYVLITRTIFKQMKIRRTYLSTSTTSLGSKFTVACNDKTPDKSLRCKSLLRSSQDVRFSGGQNEMVLDKKTVTFTLLMLTITAVVLLGFVPYLALSFWRIFEGRHASETIAGAEWVAFQVGIRSVLLNSAVNPLIYGFFNSRFRDFWYRAVCCSCCCLRRPHGNTDSRTVEKDS